MVYVSQQRNTSAEQSQLWKKEWEKLYKKASSPLPDDYHAEMDITPLLSLDDCQLFASYIGILQWVVELVQIDLTQAVSLMTQFCNAPCKGHMVAVLRIFCFIKGHLNAKVVFDPAYRDWTTQEWHDDAGWKEFYLDASESIFPWMPEPLGNEVQVYYNMAHATCLAT